MIRVTCDGCDKPIDRDNEGWFGLDHTPALDDDIALAEEDDPGSQFGANLKIETLKIGSFGGDHEFHFCSPDCLASWAFKEGLD